MAPIVPQKPQNELILKIRLAVDALMFLLSIFFYLGTKHWEWLFIAPLASAMFLAKYRQLKR